MPTTCKLIAKSTLGSAASTVTFDSIPSTATDLLFLVSPRGTNYTELRLAFNTAATTDLTSRSIQGTGSSAVSYSLARGYVCEMPVSTATANTFGNVEIYIPNYAGSTNKSYSATGVSENNATAAEIVATAGLWSNTSAITKVVFSCSTGQFAAESSFFLYGITKA